MANETPHDSPRHLDDLRREVVEARNMTIKTDNALRSLHAELKTVAQTQLEFQHRTWFSTGAAYLTFAALCAIGAYALSNAKAAAVTADRERIEKQLADQTSLLEKTRADMAATAALERQASEVYRLLTALPGDERLKGVEALTKLDRTKVSPFAWQVLNDRATLLRKELGSASFERGKAAFRKQDWAETIDQLNRLMGMNPVEEDALEASYYLGNAYMQTRRFDEAVKHLGRFVESDKRARNRDYAMLMLSQTHDALGNRDKGAEVAREALSTYPSSEFRVHFQARLQRTAMPAPAAQARPVGPAPGATPSAPGAVPSGPPKPALKP